MLRRFIPAVLAGLLLTAPAVADAKLTRNEARQLTRDVAHSDSIIASTFRPGVWVDKTGPGVFDYSPATFTINPQFRGQVVRGSFDRLGANAAIMRVYFTAVSDRGQWFRSDHEVLIRERGANSISSVL